VIKVVLPKGADEDDTGLAPENAPVPVVIGAVAIELGGAVGSVHGDSLEVAGEIWLPEATPPEPIAPAKEVAFRDG